MRRGSLVTVDNEALNRAIAASGLSLRGVATAIIRRAGSQSQFDSLESAREHETIRKTLGEVCNGKQRRIRTPLLIRLAKVLKVKKGSLVAATDTRMKRGEPSAKQLYASKLAAQLLNNASKDLVDPIRGLLEAALDFDSWHHALGNSAIEATDPRLKQLRTDFARHQYRALSVLFRPVRGHFRSFDPDALQRLSRAFLVERNALLNERLEKLPQARRFGEIAEEAASEIAKRLADEKGRSIQM